MSGSFALFPNAPGRRGQQNQTPPLQPAQQPQPDADGSADVPQTAAGGAMPPASWRAGVASAGHSQFSQFTTSVLSHGSLGLSSTMTAGSSFTSSISSTNSALSNESDISSSSNPAEAAGDADGSPTWTPSGASVGGITAAISPAQMHEFRRGLQAGQQAVMDALRNSVESIRASLADIKLLVQEAASAEQASDSRRIETLAAQIAAAKAAALRRVAALQTATDPQTVHAQPHAAAIARTVIPNLYSHHRQTQMHSQTQFPATTAYPTAPLSHSISAPSHQIQSSNSQLDPFVLGFAQSTAKIHQQGNRFANSMRQKILATPTPGKPSIQNALDPNHSSVDPSATATTSSNGSASMSTRSVSSITSPSSATANRTHEQQQPSMLVENRYSPIASGFGVLSLSAENSSNCVGGNDMHIEPDACAVQNQILNINASSALNEDTGMLTATNEMHKQYAMNAADASRNQDDIDMEDVNELPSADPGQQAHQTDIAAVKQFDVSQSWKQGQGDVVSLVASDASKIKKVIRKLVKFKQEVYNGGFSAGGSPARAAKLVDDNMAESMLTKTRKLYMSAAIIQSHMHELLIRDALLYPLPSASASSNVAENAHSGSVDERQQQQIQSNTELLAGHAQGRQETQQFLEKSERMLRGLVCSIFSRWPTVALPNFDDIAMTAAAATSGGSFVRHGIHDQRSDHVSRMMGGAGDQMHALTSLGSLASQQTIHNGNDAVSTTNTDTFLSASTTSFSGTDLTDPSRTALKVETNLNGSTHPSATSAAAVTAPSASSSSVAARAGMPGTTSLSSRRARSKKLYKKLFGF